MIPPLCMTDFYKTDHISQYPKGTEFIYSNWTARESRLPGIDKIVVFGIQYFIKEFLIHRFNDGFFNRPKAEVVAAYKRRMDNSLGKDAVDMKHIEQLHDLGYLPVTIKALPEGTLCPIGIPCLTIINTKEEFYWVTNFLETLLSNSLWQAMTSATIAYNYRKILDRFAKATSSTPEFVSFQGHDFSMRGLSSMESASISSAAHLLSFVGTDTISAIDFLEQYYNANSDEELIACSVPATEHSVMSIGEKGNELQTFKRLITEIYPKGIVSIVSDTWNFWKVVHEYLDILKDTILARDGKLVIRPDSGDPIKILCGDPEAPSYPENKGAVELLWDTFGGKVNDKGFKELDPHIGLIYGDSITMARANTICSILQSKGFASTNVVFGIGSYTYQYNTRDVFGFAMKATWGMVNGKKVVIYKDPLTDNGCKKSARGLLRVNNDKTLNEEVTLAEESNGLLQAVFSDGELLINQTLSGIRDRLKNEV